MAPSSTPYAGSRASVLAARDARQASLDLHRGEGPALVALSLAVPGREKLPPGAGALFAWAFAEVVSAFPGARSLHASSDALGPFAIWTAPAAPVVAKTRCVAIESSRPAARLVDLDVYSPEGASLDRASLHLPARVCLCCEEPARDCIRLGRHGLHSLEARARALLTRGPA